jgi:DNA polymerase I-like protein with 3'-5' exonuclease and polymerase domains
LHPGDHKIHHVYNQQAAETGRSSSEKPNGQNIPKGEEYRSCYIADSPDEEEPEGYCYVTADMSGAELRIIADRSGDNIWCGCFDRGEDVHSVGAEILNPDIWPTLALPDCKYYALNNKGVPSRKKCKCPGHEAVRQENKSNNFLLAYGGTASKLSIELGKSKAYCQELMNKHEAAFPAIWAYLEDSGKKAQMLGKAFDMWGRRRLFPEPTWERAVEKAKSDREEKLQYPANVAAENVRLFTLSKGRKPNKDEKYILLHRPPTNGEIGNAFQALGWSVTRQGKNHEIQGTNATIAKISMSMLWKILPKYKAKLVKFVHDELVIMCPKRFGQAVADEIGKSFKVASAIKMKRVTMEFDYHIGPCWEK